jgi:ABC-type multidrug transport system fused ATPase/permease subunit
MNNTSKQTTSATMARRAITKMMNWIVKRQIDLPQKRQNFKSVYFSYPARPDVPVLVDFSLHIPPNTTVAFVGTSGTGKIA